jgi:putative photosynthetic complex assembly protein 2
MAEHGLPLAFALFVWWFSTGLVLYLDQLPRHTYRWSVAGATVVLVAALYALVRTSADTSAAGAYCAFSCAVLVWGWLEMTYFTGFVTGPREAPCPPGATGWRRFGFALQASLYHELAIVAMAGAIVALTWGEANQVGTWTFVVLWVMRWSAKLNLFLGVPNLNEAFLPEHLRFLRTYIPKRSMNALFPVSVTLATIAAVLLAQGAIAADGFEAAGLTLIAGLLVLAILEHWFLVLPLHDAALWSWALRAREARALPRTAP